MRQTLFYGDHPAVALSLYAVGVAHDKLKKYKQALEHFECALQMYQELRFAADHPEVVACGQAVERARVAVA